MKTVFLKNGQEVLLKKELGEDGYLVETLMIYQDHDGNESIEPSGNNIVVNEIFTSCPIEKISDEYKKINDKVIEKENELKELNQKLYQEKYELENIKAQKTNLNKLIFNKSEIKNAKRISFFNDRTLLPQTVSDKAKNSMKFSLSFSIFEGKMSIWTYELNDGDSWNGYSNYIDPEYGLLIDITDEELNEITKKRINSKPLDYFNEYYLVGVGDELLTPQLVKKKNDFIKNKENKEIKEWTNKLEEAQNKLN